MQKVRVDLGDRSYNIVIGDKTLREVGEALEKFDFTKKLALVSNPTVYGLYGDAVVAAARGAGFDVVTIIIPDGEEHKNLTSIQAIYDELLATRLDRRSAVVALGGGVIGDITGFAASTYMRGIDFVQIPTTLLAQVDSSVGGKTGVNHTLGKNMIGTFWQPRLVWVDIGTLTTLPRREFLAGIAEVIKYGVIRDRELFDFLEANKEAIMGLDRGALGFIIRRSCEIKAAVVRDDEREAGLRAILNYGHTIGHAVETQTRYSTYLHGEAVAIGMNIEARLSCKLGMLDADDALRIQNLIKAYELPIGIAGPAETAHILDLMRLDKKTVAGEVKFILPTAIGSVEIKSGVEPGEVLSLLEG